MDDTYTCSMNDENVKTYCKCKRSNAVHKTVRKPTKRCYHFLNKIFSI